VAKVRAMLKPLLAAAALAAVAAPASLASPTDCVSTFVHAVTHNPVRPLPSGGGGGEPHTPLTGDPVGYVLYDVNAATAAVKCLP
jgi:hypothetical protein